MATQLTISTVDRLGKPTSTTINVADAITDPQAQAIADAFDGVLLGSAVKAVKTVATVVDGGSQVPPSDKSANRMNKWLYRIQDDTTSQIYTHEIGTADDAQLPVASSDFLDLSAGVGLALASAIEAAYRSPDGNTGTVLSVQQVNRSGS